MGVKISGNDTAGGAVGCLNEDYGRGARFGFALQRNMQSEPVPSVRDRLLSTLSVASLLVFLALALAVKTVPGLQSWDLQAALSINQLSLGGFVNGLLVDASMYGREYFWVLVVAVLFLFGDRRTKLVAVGLCGVFVAGIVAGELAKEIVARPRPFTYLPVVSLNGQYVLRMPLETDYSFPSGHALIVSIGAVYCLLTFRRKWLAALLTLEAAIVAFSRVYTFQHFPTDVLAGVALGSAIALAGLLLGRRYLSDQAGKAADYVVRLLKDGPLKV